MNIYLSRPLLAILLLLLFSSRSPAFEAALPVSGGLKVKADSITYDKNTDTYDAVGKVRIDWSGVIMYADQVLLRQGDNEAVAQGNVQFRKGDDTLDAERVTLDLESSKGVVENGRLFVKQGNFRLSGARLMKTGDDDYHVEKGYFTTCDGEVPSWKFSAAELDVTRKEYAVGRHAVFYIKDVPVLYFPYIIYPVTEERQSGFLLPRVGLSSKKGFYLEVPYYLVIDPSQDATFYLDVETKRGAGLGAEYRYMLRAGGFGNLNAYLIYDTNEDMLRGNFLIRHQQSFSPTLFFRADIDMALDRNFYRDYGEVNGEYNRQYLESSAFVTKHWERYSLTGELRYTENLYAVNNKATLQKLPIITFTGIKQQLGETPLFVSFDSNFTNFYRKNGVQGQRLDLHPMLTYYMTPGGVLEGMAWAGYRQRIYNAYSGDGPSGFKEKGVPDVGASLSTTYSRVFDAGWGSLKKVKHTIIPEVGYSFQPQKDQDDLPFFDYNDRLVSQNMISYSVTNYLTGKYESGDAPASYRDLGYLRISQGYEFGGTRRDVLTLVDDQRPFTDVRIEAKVNPTELLSFELDSRFNPYRTDFSILNFSADIADGDGNSVGVGYRYARDEVRYLEGKLNVSYVEPFIFHYLTRYSFDTRDFLESYYALEYKQQCWGVTFSYRERPGDRSFIVNFSLSGIGAIGKFKAF